MGNRGEPVRTQQESGDLGGSTSGTDIDDHEKEKAGMVWPRQKKRRNRKQPSSCRNEDGGDAAEVEIHCQEGPESLEHQG